MKPTDFLKKYTSISNKFIDDFYKFHDDNYTEYDYVINIDKIASWVGKRKDNLKKNFNRKFRNR
jgi:hypothetical protein